MPLQVRSVASHERTSSGRQWPRRCRTLPFVYRRTTIEQKGGSPHLSSGSSGAPEARAVLTWAAAMLVGRCGGISVRDGAYRYQSRDGWIASTGSDNPYPDQCAGQPAAMERPFGHRRGRRVCTRAAGGAAAHWNGRARPNVKVDPEPPTGLQARSINERNQSRARVIDRSMIGVEPVARG